MIDHSPFTLQNNGEGTFTQQAISFKQKHWGSAPFADIDADGDRDTRSTIELGDFNNDGKTDVLLNGFSGLYARNVASMYTNIANVVNTQPIAPAGLTTPVAGDSVSFSWFGRRRCGNTCKSTYL